MKKLIAIVFENDEKYGLLSNQICELFSKPKLGEEQEFCGLWGEIQYNTNEVINSISATVNYFLKSTKKEIFFGCCEKDFEKILAKINVSDYIVEKTCAEGILEQ